MQHFSTLHPVSQTERVIDPINFEQICNGILNEEREMQKVFSSWFFKNDNIFDYDHVFLLQGTLDAAIHCEEEHYWYEWDVGETVIPIMMDQSNRKIYGAKFEIEECWHRSWVKANPQAIFQLVETNKQTLDTDLFQMTGWNSVELTGPFFNPTELTKGMDHTFDEGDKEKIEKGFSLMNDAAFHCGANFLCRY